MHLLATLPGQISDGEIPADPNQSAADIVVLSAADAEIASLAAANAASGASAQSLRLCQLSCLSHPYSVDLYIDKTVSHARLAVVRALGGLPYWRYCIEQFAERLAKAGGLFAALPGDDSPDDELFAHSSVSREDWVLMHRYCSEGGPVNAARFLQLCRRIAVGGPMPLPPTPLLKAGLYQPSGEVQFPSVLRHAQSKDSPSAAIVLYRAWLQGGNTEPVDRLISALEQRGIRPVPIFASSLKDPVSACAVRQIIDQSCPDIVLNLTGFAIGVPAGLNGCREPTVLEGPGRPVLQVMLASCSASAWAGSANGIPPRGYSNECCAPGGGRATGHQSHRLQGRITLG